MTRPLQMRGKVPFQGVLAVNIDFSALKPYYQERFGRILRSNERDTGGWNWSAFLFGCFWALSKGLWLSALVMFALPLLTDGVFLLLTSLVYGFRGNYLYYRKYVKNQQNVL